jgi:hypothetical protein
MRIGTPLPKATIRRAISSPEGPGMSRSRTARSVGVDAEQFQGGVAVAGDIGGDRFQPETVTDGFGQVGLVLHDQHPHT